MLYQAHRGVCTECPENTIPAFRRAQEQGYQILEMDPKFTSDNICVLHHDHNINRTCRTADGQVIKEPTPIKEVSYARLQKLDAGAWFGEEFRGTRVPLLSETLELAKEHSTHVKIDNVFASFPMAQQQILFDIVEASGADVGFTCANEETVHNVVTRFPKAPIHYDGFVDEAHILAVKAMLKENPLVVWLPFDNDIIAWCTLPKADPDLCAMVKRHAGLGIWILSEEADLKAAEAMGADIIETTGALKP